MIEIRPARLEDREALVILGLHYAAAAPNRELFPELSRARVGRIVDSLFELRERAGILVAVVDDALVGGIVTIAKRHRVTGDDYADHLAWWVEPSHRGGLLLGPQLLTAAETWAVDHALTFLTIGAPTPAFGRFYERRGYRAVETTFIKRFP